MIDVLAAESRLVLDAHLAPVAGSVFQPTGFPDLGAAEFTRPGQSPAVLVESVQSMTNHLEALGWDAAAQRPTSVLAKLPYVEVTDADDGGWLTSSRTEPHRLASAYIREAELEGKLGIDWITERLGVKSSRPLDWRTIYRAIFEMDPLCLLHGVFFSDRRWRSYGNPKVRRALSLVIEAHDAAPVVSGGLKRDDVQFVHEAEVSGRGAAEGYGFVPFGRTEYAARELILTAVVDLQQLRGYGLGEAPTRLLENLALWEVTSLLEGSLRLRTACDLEVSSVTARRPGGFSMPNAAILAEEIQSSSVEFEHAEPWRAVWPASGEKPA